MRFGICTGNYKAAVAAGFDYVELGVAGNLSPEKPEAEILAPIEAALKAAGIGVEAFNGFLPGDLRVTGEVIDIPRQTAYLQSAFKRVARLGGKIVVFGSGGARQVPDGFSRDTAYDQIHDFLLRAGDIAAQHDVAIAIEPLCQAECNILTSVAEATAVAKRANHPAVQVLSDFYHVDRDAQSYQETALAGKRLRHVHIAAPGSRQNPTEADVPILTSFFRALREAGYDERISFECGWSDFELDGAASLAVVRKAWDASGV